jgi:hypothetical protein
MSSFVIPIVDNKVNVKFPQNVYIVANHRGLHCLLKHFVPAEANMIVKVQAR